MSKDNYVFFWRSASPFSNWYHSPFVATIYRPNGYESFTFDNTEQWMMYQKAKLFNDDVIAEKILSEPDPRKIKALGKEVMGFDSNVWDENKERLVYDGLKLKFEQNKSCMDALMSTGDKKLVEASPYDQIWGIGLDEFDTRAHHENTWRGQNLLGKLLTKLRDEIKNSKHD